MHKLSHVFMFVGISRSYVVGRSKTFDVSRYAVSRNRFSPKRNVIMGRVVPANIFLPKKNIAILTKKQDVKCTYKRNLRRVHATIVAVEMH